jgi:hypothetical protein
MSQTTEEGLIWQSNQSLSILGGPVENKRDGDLSLLITAGQSICVLTIRETHDEARTNTGDLKRAVPRPFESRADGGASGRNHNLHIAGPVETEWNKEAAIHVIKIADNVLAVSGAIRIKRAATSDLELKVNGLAFDSDIGEWKVLDTVARIAVRGANNSVIIFCQIDFDAYLTVRRVNGAACASKKVIGETKSAATNTVRCATCIAISLFGFQRENWVNARGLACG